VPSCLAVPFAVCTAVKNESSLAFCGATITMQALNVKLALGEEIDLGLHALVAGAMVRLARRLGLGRRPRDISGPSLGDLMRQDQQRQIDEAAT
jgi:hypothetical protein